MAIEPTQVFWCEPSGKVRRWLRCYDSRPEAAAVDDTQPKRCERYCNAVTLLDEIEAEFEETDDQGRKRRKSYDAKNWPWDAFPTVCEVCRRPMANPQRQVFADEVMVVKTGPRAGQTFVRGELPVGAMWDAHWYHDWPRMVGRDGIALMVMTPDGEWNVDSRASNCSKPNDQGHKCWVRRGDPRTGYCHVDKGQPGESCDAGGGSIWMRMPNGFHGFLHRGYLIECHDRARVDAMLDQPEANPVAPAERVLKPNLARPARTVGRPVVPPPVPERRPGWRSNRSHHAGRLKR